MSLVRKTLAAGVLLTTLAAVAGATSPAAAQDPPVADPVGEWVGTVVHDLGENDVHFSFQPDGTVCLVPGPPDPSGGGEGGGYWWTQDGSEFGFTVTERLFDGDGETIARLMAFQTAQQSGDTYDSEGFTLMFDANWDYLDTLTAQMFAERVSTTPVPC